MPTPLLYNKIQIFERVTRYTVYTALMAATYSNIYANFLVLSEVLNTAINAEINNYKFPLPKS